MSLVTIISYLEKSGIEDKELQALLSQLAETIKLNEQLQARRAERVQELEHRRIELDMLELLHDMRADEQADALEMSETANDMYGSFLKLRMQFERLAIPTLFAQHLQFEKLQIQQNISGLQSEFEKDMSRHERMEARGVVQDLRRIQHEHKLILDSVQQAECKAKESIAEAQQKHRDAQRLLNDKILNLVVGAKQLQQLRSEMAEANVANPQQQTPLVAPMAETAQTLLAPQSFLNFLAQFQASKAALCQAASEKESPTLVPPLRSILSKPASKLENTTNAPQTPSTAKHVTFQQPEQPAAEQEDLRLPSSEGSEDEPEVAQSAVTIEESSDSQDDEEDDDEEEGELAESKFDNTKQLADRAVVVDNCLVQPTGTSLPFTLSSDAPDVKATAKPPKNLTKSDDQHMNDFFGDFMQCSNEVAVTDGQKDDFASPADPGYSFGDFFTCAPIDFSDAEERPNKADVFLDMQDTGTDVADSNYL